MSGEIGVHWEAAAPPSSPGQAVIQWEAIRAYHKAHGYADIAYNFGVTDFGQVLNGRGWAVDTAANGPGHNRGNRAVCWLGGPGYSPTPRAYEAAGTVVREGISRGFNIVYPHSHYVATQCPGDDWRAWVARQGWQDAAPPEPTNNVRAREGQSMVIEELNDDNTTKAFHYLDPMGKIGQVDRAMAYSLVYGLAAFPATPAGLPCIRWKTLSLIGMAVRYGWTRV